jgi:hypothetical protein
MILTLFVDAFTSAVELLRMTNYSIWVLAVVVYVLILKMPEGTEETQENSQYSYLIRFEPEIFAIRSRI